MSETTRRMRLHRAYRATLYRVTGTEPAFDLAIDRRSPELVALFQERGVDQCAYLTAHNPRSRPTDGTRNAAWQALLLDRIQELGLEGIEGLGVDPAGIWLAEKSVLVPGMLFAMACLLAREFEQEALVFAGPDAIPRLALLT